MTINPDKHMDRQTDTRTDRQMLDKVIPICCYASQATQKYINIPSYVSKISEHVESMILSCIECLSITGFIYHYSVVVPIDSWFSDWEETFANGPFSAFFNGPSLNILHRLCVVGHFLSEVVYGPWALAFQSLLVQLK